MCLIATMCMRSTANVHAINSDLLGNIVLMIWCIKCFVYGNIIGYKYKLAFNYHIFVTTQDSYDSLLYIASTIAGGLRGIFQSYLSKRSRPISVDGHLSDPLPVNISVPQGSILSSLLFLHFYS